MESILRFLISLNKSGFGLKKRICGSFHMSTVLTNPGSTYRLRFLFYCQFFHTQLSLPLQRLGFFEPVRNTSFYSPLRVTCYRLFCCPRSHPPPLMEKISSLDIYNHFAGRRYQDSAWLTQSTCTLTARRRNPNKLKTNPYFADRRYPDAAWLTQMTCTLRTKNSNKLKTNPCLQIVGIWMQPG